MDIWSMIREQRTAEARAEGRVEGEARLLLRLLERRGFTVSSELAARVRATSDLATIEAWADRTLDARSLEDVFGANVEVP